MRQAKAGAGTDATPLLLKAYQPPEELAACREGDLFIVHNLTDKCVHCFSYVAVPWSSTCVP